MPEVRSADRQHVPELERSAYNQMPKTRDHREPRLYRYEGTNLYQWYSKRGDSVFWDPCDQPFVIEHQARTEAPAPQGEDHVADGGKMVVGPTPCRESREALNEGFHELWGAFYDVEERSVVPTIRWQRLERAIKSLEALSLPAPATQGDHVADSGKMIAVHFAEPDYLEFVQRDVPTFTQPAQAGLDVLLTMDTREPIGWRIYGWSKIAPQGDVEGVDLEGLEKIAREATPGPWEWWSSCSHWRLTAEGGPDGGVLSATKASDGFPLVVCSEEDRSFIAAFDPPTVLKLLSALRSRTGVGGPDFSVAPSRAKPGEGAAR